jgi:biotin-dependent carboxylase-like uncharacterized protein
MINMFKVLEPGPYTTIQDQGRFGYQQFGIPAAGALDQFAYRIANMLVANSEDAAVLEITFMGPCLEVMAEADIAITGAQIPVSINEQTVAIWSSVRVNPGDVLTIGQVESGCRAYLAVTGGIDVPIVMGSRSCYTNAKIGGLKGRPIAKSDIIDRGKGALSGTLRRLPPQYVPHYDSNILLRAVPGPQDDFFDHGLIAFFQSAFTVSPQANRMGYRLQGPVIPLREGVPKSIISEPSIPGGVQIPADGQPIILLVEQTVGGYTKIATVISSDLPRVAQAMPGDEIRFERVGLEIAHQVFRQQRKMMGNIKDQILSG